MQPPPLSSSELFHHLRQSLIPSAVRLYFPPHPNLRSVFMDLFILDSSPKSCKCREFPGSLVRCTKVFHKQGGDVPLTSLRITTSSCEISGESSGVLQTSVSIPKIPAYNSTSGLYMQIISTCIWWEHGFFQSTLKVCYFSENHWAINVKLKGIGNEWEALIGSLNSSTWKSSLLLMAFL